MYNDGLPYMFVSVHIYCNVKYFMFRTNDGSEGMRHAHFFLIFLLSFSPLFIPKREGGGEEEGDSRIMLP